MSARVDNHVFPAPASGRGTRRHACVNVCERACVCSMYKFMEGQLLESRNRLKVKIPDIEASLECIAMLKKKKVRARMRASSHSNAHMPAPTHV